MFTSLLNDDYCYNESIWVITKLNTGSKTGGHNKIMIEGLESGGKNYIFQCHINVVDVKEDEKATLPNNMRNITGKIKPQYIITEFLRDEIMVRYRNCSRRAWQVSKNDAMKIIDNVKKEVEDFDKGKFRPYQSAGRHRFFGGNGGDNCATWVEEKLALINLSTGKKPFDAIKASPELHVRCNIL